MKKVRKKLDKLFQGRYGLDDFGKALLVLSFITYILGIIFQSEMIFSLSIVGVIITLCRVMSCRHWDRSEENRKYMSYTKLWKLKYENRKYSRIFMCKRCGKYIRVPKGKGKIQVTCTACGDKTIRHT